MQTLTIPASISKKKQACVHCRHKKKKCDVRKLTRRTRRVLADTQQAARPRCSLCRRLNLTCEYSVPTSNGRSESIRDFEPVSDASNPIRAPTWIPRQEAVSAFPFMQSPGMNVLNLSDNFAQGIPNGTALTPESSNDASVLDRSIDQLDPLREFQLPTGHVIQELAELFFHNVYHMFPCFHRRSFMMQINDGSLQKDSPLVLYAVCCVAARFHPDKEIRKREREWYESARFHYDVTLRDPYPALRTMQAVSLLILQAWVSGDFSSSWLFIGKAWRQAVALGLNKMDASDSFASTDLQQRTSTTPEIGYGVSKTRMKTAVEREEMRRALWLLFILDRNHAWPTVRWIQSYQNRDHADY